MDTLNFRETYQLALAAVDSDTPLHIIGSPGIGKSALAAMVGKELGLKVETMILSLCEPTDVGGFPVAREGGLDRLPMGAILRASTEGVVLFLDELSCATPPVQGAALRLVYERIAGDLRLHPDTRIFAASNEMHEAANGNDISLPMIGRMTQVRFHPHLDEVQTYFYSLGEPDSPLRQLAVDFAATMGKETKLLQISPPAGAIAVGQPWGAPRNWERGLRLAVAVMDRTKSTKLFASALACNVGEDLAGAFLAIRKVREKLPTVAEVLKDPKNAEVPTDVSTEIAALGIIAQVALSDPWAAWTYAGRLSAEALLSTAHLLVKHPIDKQSSPWYKTGYQVRLQALNRSAEAMRE